ncbi:Zinc finger protein 62, partial [Araneus ventricosus]
MWKKKILKNFSVSDHTDEPLIPMEETEISLKDVAKDESKIQKTHVDYYECGICNKKYIPQKKFIEHLLAHIGGTKHACSLCEKIFWKTPEFYSHLNVHLKRTPYSCSECHKNFLSCSQLRFHSKMHAETIQCHLCKGKFPSQKLLDQHMRLHMVDESNTCIICQKTSLGSQGLCVHLFYRPERAQLCDTCGRTFTTKRSLEYHRYMH